MTRKAIFIFLAVWIVCSLAVEGADLQRLDPHGSTGPSLSTVKRSDACLVCHRGESGGSTAHWALKGSASQSCVQCHSPLPHGGAAEHMNKVRAGEPGGAVGCLSCHSAHRAGSAPQMVRRGCTECHAW